MDIENSVRKFFTAIDESFEVLSKGKEGFLVNLPEWALANRKIVVCVTIDEEIVVVNACRDNDLHSDEVSLHVIEDEVGANKYISPMKLSGNYFSSIEKGGYEVLPELLITSANNPLGLPIKVDTTYTFIGRVEGFLSFFNKDNAKEIASYMWKGCCSDGRVGPRSYIFNVKNILNALELIIKRKAFLERRIHRFINKHRNVLLPSYTNCYYEHTVFRNGNYRRADFILEREMSFPPLLIELEPPHYKVFTRKMEFTKEVNHARGQIAEWIAYIDSETQTNAAGEFAFLLGNKDRLVIIGRGLEHRDRLLETKFDNTTVWTYDIFIEEARKRLNDNYENNCRLLNMRVTRPF